MKPVLRAFVPCLDIIGNPDGTFTLLGVLQHIVVLKLPIMIELRVYFVWAGMEDQEYDVSMEVQFPGANAPRVQNYSLRGFPGGRFDVARDIWLRDGLLAEGDVQFKVFMDGVLEHTFHLPVVYREEKAATTA